MEVIQRVCSVRLKNFKGFVGCSERMDTDAEIVLLTGPNGYGKTSFLEALTAILTGFHPYGDHDAIQALVPTGRSETELASEIEILAEVDSGDGKEETTTLTIGWDGNGSITIPESREGETNITQGLPRPTSFPPSRLDGFERYELHARLCAFFQERITFQYDQGAQGNTIRDVIEPISPGVRMIIDKLGKFAEKDMLQHIHKYREFSSQGSDEEIRSRLEQKALPVMASYNEASQWPGMEWLSGPASFANGAEASEFFRSALRRRGIEIAGNEHTDLAAEIQKQVGLSLTDWIRDAERRAAGFTEEGRRLEEMLRECEKKLRFLERKYPNLELEVALFNPENDDGCDALVLLRTLAASANRWATVELPDEAERDQGRLREVLNEFGRVDENRAAECRNILDKWFGVRKDAWKEFCSSREEKLRLERELIRYRSSEEVDAGKRIQRELRVCFDDFSKAWEKACKRERERAEYEKRRLIADALDRHLTAARTLLHALDEETAISPKLRKHLEESVQDIAGRFSLSDGMLPLRLKCDTDKRGIKDKERRIYCLQAADSRKMVNFSTGQKAQLGISLLVAQNLYLSRFLPQRIILLDDLTTAYDLTNLTREAILWRQLAYNRQRDNPCARQVFISTHHEDLTSNLLGLLVPPAGYSMRVIKFCGYDRDKGPQIEVYRVESTGEIATVRERLAAELQNYHP